MELIQGLGGDAGFGENILDRNDDESTDFIDLSTVFPNGLNFFGQVYNGLYVNNNGSVTFNEALSTFTPETISDGTIPGIFPFWADVDTDGGEATPTPGGTSQGTNLVYYDLDDTNNIFTVTWDDVGYFSENTDLLNAFQLIIADLSDNAGRAPGDFSITFKYEDINWVTGDASDGEGGFGGTPARAGYSAGNAEGTFYELPQSGNEAALLELDTLSDFVFVSSNGIVVENNAPVANDDSGTAYETDEDTTLLAAPSFLGNDTDADGDSLEIVAINGGTPNFAMDINLPSGAILNINEDGDIIGYNPNGAFESLNDGESTVDAFTYTISDGQEEDTATVSITVNGVTDNVNTPPVASDDANEFYETDEDTPLLNAPSFLDNDFDADADNLEIVAINGNTPNFAMDINLPSGAILNIDEDGFIIGYNPNGAFEFLNDGESTVDAFTYTISDGQEEDTATVSIKVNGVTDETPPPSDEINGTEGIDSLKGTNMNDIINGLGGDDVIVGRFGMDTIDGGDGDDFIAGQASADVLTGGAGNDVFVYRLVKDSSVQTGVDKIADFTQGEDKIDIAALGAVALSDLDIQTAGGETNIMFGDFKLCLSGEFALTADDFVFGEDLSNVLNGTDGSDTIKGGNDAEVINGLAGDDILLGRNGDDTINGGDGNDLIAGQSLSDMLIGGAGADTLIGGSQSDTFLYEATTDSQTSTGAVDLITDFVAGLDKVDVSALGILALTSNATAASTELRVAYDAVEDTTSIISDDADFSVLFSGDLSATLSNADFVFAV